MATIDVDDNTTRRPVWLDDSPITAARPVCVMNDRLDDLAWSPDGRWIALRAEIILNWFAERL